MVVCRDVLCTSRLIRECSDGYCAWRACALNLNGEVTKIFGVFQEIAAFLKAASNIALYPERHRMPLYSAAIKCALWRELSRITAPF